MQTTYRSGNKGRKSTQKEKKTQGQGRQLVQLLLCLALFLAVFIGKGVFPREMAQTAPRLLEVIRTNTDFRGAFSSLGRALSQRESVLGELGEFCVKVFGPIQDSHPSAVTANAPLDDHSVPGTEQVRQMESDIQGEEQTGIQEAEKEPEEQEGERGGQMNVGDIVQAVSVQGQALPENYTYDHLWLGSIQTQTPVSGTVTSQFGYRDHPTIGRYAVHGGVDIGAEKGAPVSAFAAGKVYAVGENSDFGKYLYIEHADGITTFYSHCDSICVKNGQQVEVGEIVARVGSTGQSTGPHLHFEVKLGDVRLDPMHYIRPEEG